MRVTVRKIANLLTPNLVALTLLILISVIVIVGIYMHQKSQPQNEKGMPSNPVATSSSTPSRPVSSTPEPSKEQGSNIGQRSIKVLEAYYLLYPGETSEQRQKRITSVINPQKMTFPDATVGQNSCWDQHRILYNLTERAKVVPDAVSVEPLNDKGAPMRYVTIPGSVQQYNKDGSEFTGDGNCPGARTFVATFTWTELAGSWTLTHFGNPERTP